jgi:uncharacterized protein (UPF0276 family)
VPAEAIQEIHLAGYRQDPLLGPTLWIDSHDTPVSPAVWQLYQRLIDRIGIRPTLIERDGQVPEFEVLMAERTQAQAMHLEAAWAQSAVAG